MSLYLDALYTSDVWPRVDAYYSRTWQEFAMSVHSHEMVEVMYVFSGNCVVEVRGKNPETRSMRTGDFVFLDSYVPHRLEIDPNIPCTMLNVEFSFEETHSSMFTLQRLRDTSQDFARFIAKAAAHVFGVDARGDLFRALDGIVRGLTPSRSGEEESCLRQGEMALFLMRLAQAVLADRPVSGTYNHVRRAMSYIQNHFAEPIRLDEIGEYTGLQKDYLGHIFRANSGESIGQYIMRTRAEHAATLLEHSEASTTDIAVQVGFGSRQHLHTSFEKYYGMTPGAYRKMRREGRMEKHPVRHTLTPKGDSAEDEE